MNKDVRNMVRVRVNDLNAGRELTNYVVDQATHEGRKRIGRCGGWALNSGYQMITEPADLTEDQTCQSSALAQENARWAFEGTPRPANASDQAAAA